MKLSRLFRGLATVFVFLFFVINGLTVGMFKNAGFINDFLDINTTVKGEGGGELPLRYNSEFAKDINHYTQDELNAKNAAALAFIESEEEEGAVLLKNDNGALPLTAEEIKKVSLFGWSAAHPYYRAHSGGGGTNGKISLKDALTNRGFTVNPTLYAALDAVKGNRKNTSVAEAPVSTYDGVASSLAEYNGAAIVVLSREAGENDDLVVNYNDGGTTQSMLALTKDEKALLDLVKGYRENGTVKKTIVLLNSSNTMEAGWLDEYKVDACLWIGGPGESSGFYGVADILKGEVNPSGKTVDTYSTSSLSAPAMANYGYVGNDLENMIYAEGIYVGYKYYETRYEDCVLARGNATSRKGAYASSGESWSYADEVTFPFGYGLSYTRFTQTLKDTRDNGDGTMTVTVNVANAPASEGGVKGKSVVQVYAQTPYGDYEKQHKVEKAAVQLAAFEKTDYIEPGANVDVNVVVDKYLLASYDASENGVKGYYLSGGKHYLAVGSDAHDALNNILAAKSATGMVDQNGNATAGNSSLVYSWDQQFDGTSFKSSKAGAAVTNKLYEADWNYWNPGAVTYLSRSDWDATYPVTYKLSMTANMKANDRYQKPADAPKATYIKTDVDAGLKYPDMFGVKLDDKDENGDNIWDKFIDQLSLDELISTSIDVKGTDAILDVAFPGGVNDDGIDGVGVNCYINPNVAASSWNKSLLRRRGEFIGEDALYRGINTQWGPGANFHRAPFSGRNFEYLGEDGVLGYELAGAQVAGTESKGVTVAIKHFFTNDQEHNRGTVKVYANEQTFREIYLRPFEGAFVKRTDATGAVFGGATSTMTTNSEVGFRAAGEFKGLINGVLHDEWGFYGIVITDAGGGFTEAHEYLASGGNMFCFVGDKADRAQKLKNAVIIKNDGNLLKIYKERAKETLYTYAHTNIMNGLTEDMKIITPWWQTAMIVLNVAVGVIAVGLIVCFVIFGYLPKKKGAHDNNDSEGGK